MWEPLKKRSLGQNTRPVGLCTFYRHTYTHLLFIFCVLLIVLLSDFQYHVSVGHDARHINTKSTTIVLVYKYIPFFQHKVYTFFYRGGILSVVLQVCRYDPGKSNNHFTPLLPKEGFPKTAYLMALKSCQLRVFFVCESRHSHRITTQMHNCHHLTFFFLVWILFFSQNT